MKANRVQHIKYLTQQPYNNLCWAACGAMIARWLYKNPEINVEHVAKTYLHNGKSIILVPDQLNQAISKEELPQVFESVRVTGDFFYKYLVSENVKLSVDNDGPIMARLESTEITNSEHVLLIIGYTSDSYLVYDPYTNSEHGLIEKNLLEKGYAKSNWADSYLNFDKKDG